MLGIIRQIIIFCLLCGSLLAQDPTFQIDVIAHMNTSNRLLLEGNTLTAATTGGLLVRSPGAEDQVINASNGLYDHRLTALERTARGQLVIGSTSGNLSFLDPTDGSIKNDQNLLGSAIIDIKAVQDTLWVLTSQFVSVYLYSNALGRYQFRESYQEFGIPVNEFRALDYLANRIWLASDAGLISAPASFLRVNLYAGANWRQTTTANGLPSNQIYDLVADAPTGQLFMATQTGVSIYNLTSFSNTSTARFNKIAIADGSVYLATDREVYQLLGTGISLLHRIGFGPILDLQASPQGELWIGISKRGIRNISTGEQILLDGPLDNYIGEILIDSQSRIWCTSGLPKDERQQGIYIKNGESWQNYRFSGGTNGFLTAMNSSLALLEDTDKNVWVGAWGGGIVIFDPELGFTMLNTLANPGSVWISSATRDDTVAVSTPAELRSILSPVSSTPYYSVVTDLLLDSRNQSIWVLNSAAGNNRALLRFHGTAFNQDAFNSANWESYPNFFSVREWFALTQDPFGDFWLASSYDVGDMGVVQARLGENNTFSSAAFTESGNNLKSNATTTVAADGDGYIWVGTRSGLSAVLGGNVFDFRDTYQPIGFQINDIFVDRENNRWFATDRGLSILRGAGSPFEGSSWLHIIPRNSSVDADIISSRPNLFVQDLPSERIHSITLDEQSGDIYLGTDAGIAILRSNPFSSPFENYDQVRVGPNPLILSSGTAASLNFFNLATRSEVKILTVNGQLIRTLDRDNFQENQGNSAIWNGRNEEGRLVSSGVYVYLITNEEGKQTSGKVMVVQQ